MYGRQKAAGVAISIHAPREGCDTGPQIHDRRQGGISIHAPREGCDCCLVKKGLFPENFNPRTP